MPTASVVTFGELMLRLATSRSDMPLQSPTFDLAFGGAEANVAVALAQLGTPSRFASVLPTNFLGDAALRELRQFGVEDSAVMRKDGRLGLYFLASGGGLRPANVLYDRAGSAFATIEPDEIDWKTALAGAQWFHTTGISLAVSEQAEAAALRGLQAARAAGCKVSFDCNFRARLWEARGDDPATIIDRFAAEADLLFADHRDLALLSGRSPAESGDAATDDGSAAQLLERYPRLTWAAHTRRQIVAGEQQLTGIIQERGGQRIASRSWRLGSVVDRVGSGDAFVAGVLHGLCAGSPIDEVIECATAAAALKHSVPGDFFRLGQTDIDVLRSGAGDIRR